MRPVSRTVDFRKGAVSATAVFAVISVAITGLAMDISINTLLSSFQGSSQQGDINWFGSNIAQQSEELCKSGSDGEAVPYDSNYTRSIPGLQGINMDTELVSANYAGSTYAKVFALDFGDGEETTITLETDSSVVTDYTCEDVTFNGTGSGDQINGMSSGAPYNYRLFSDSEGEVTVQILPGDG